MNSKKNILIISPFFFPEPISTGKFNSDLAVALSDGGHNVTILCFHPIYPDWKVSKSSEKLKNITIVRGGSNLKFSKKTILRRLVLEVGFAFFVLKNLRRYNKKIDLVIPVFPPSFAFYTILPFLSKTSKKVGMIHDLQEIYSSNKKGEINRIVKFVIHKIEKRCFNSCDKLILLSNEMKETALNLYGLDNRKLEIQYPFHTIKNEITNNLSEILKADDINIVYSGALGEKQNPIELYNFFKFASKKIDNVVFHFFSQGSVFDDLKKENKNSQIKFHNLVLRENLEELYSRCDLQIIPQLPNTSKGSLPSKLPNLLASGCKTLIITDKESEIELLFNLQNIGTVINSWNFTIILKTIQSILSKDIDVVFQKEIAKELFTIDKTINKILN